MVTKVFQQRLGSIMQYFNLPYIYFINKFNQFYSQNISHIHPLLSIPSPPLLICSTALSLLPSPRNFGVISLSKPSMSKHASAVLTHQGSELVGYLTFIHTHGPTPIFWVYNMLGMFFPMGSATVPPQPGSLFLGCLRA